MNKFFWLCFLLFAPVSLASADLKIAVVDLSKVFDQYYKTHDAQQLIKQKADNYNRDIQEMTATYDHMVDDANNLEKAATDPTLSAAAQADKKKELSAKVQDVRDMDKKRQEAATERGHEIEDTKFRLHKEIVDEISKVVVAYSGPQGFDLVIDKSSSSTTGVPSVLYSSNKLTDITADVIKKLNAGAPPASAGIPAPSGAGTPVQ